MSLRVLHVLDHSLPLQAGYAFRTAALLREQQAMGWQTFHVTSPKHYGATADVESAGGFEFHRTRVAQGGWRRWPVLDQVGVVMDTAQRLEGLWPTFRPDIVHAHSPCLMGLAALNVARRHGTPVVYEMRASWEDAAVDHGTTTEGSLRYRASRALETYVLKRVDGITTICEGLAGDIASRGVAREAITLVRNAVDARDFQPIVARDEPLAERLGIGAGPVLGFAGSFYGYEGIDVLLRAVPSFAAAHPGVEVLLVGGGPAEPELRRLATELGIEARVRFTGRVPHDQVRSYYSLIDVLVYARKSMRLTELVTPLKPLEAMALQRTFVASDVGGHRELIPDALRSYVFRAGDHDDLSRTLLRVLAERDRWPELLGAARRYVVEQCTWARSARCYRDVYSRALGRPLDP